jgi:hypothetical protein
MNCAWILVGVGFEGAAVEAFLVSWLSERAGCDALGEGLRAARSSGSVAVLRAAGIGAEQSTGTRFFMPQSDL